MAIHQRAISAKHAGELHLQHALHNVVQPSFQNRAVHDALSHGFFSMRLAGKNGTGIVGRANHIGAFGPVLCCFATPPLPGFILPLSGPAFYIDV